MANRQIRPIRVEGNLAFVPLTKGYEAVIDAADVDLVSGVNWCAHVVGRTAYAVRTARKGGRNQTLYMQRIVISAGRNDHVDHWDGNGLNNTRANLRTASVSQNMHNQRRRNDNASGFKGVGFRKTDGKWRARIADKGQRVNLGLFGCPTAAAIAYARASQRLHGEFGRCA